MRTQYFGTNVVTMRSTSSGANRDGDTVLGQVNGRAVALPKLGFALRPSWSVPCASKPEPDRTEVDVGAWEPNDQGEKDRSPDEVLLSPKTFPRSLFLFVDKDRNAVPDELHPSCLRPVVSVDDDDDDDDDAEANPGISTSPAAKVLSRVPKAGLLLKPKATKRCFPSHASAIMHLPIYVSPRAVTDGPMSQTHTPVAPPPPASRMLSPPRLIVQSSVKVHNLEAIDRIMFPTF